MITISSEAYIYIYISVDHIIIGWENGLLLVWHLGIIWTNADLFLIIPLWMNFSEIWIKIKTILKQENEFC